MRREYTLGDLYTLGRPLNLVRFVKVLGAGPTSVWVRPFARPPMFQWDVRPGVPTLIVEPDPDDELAGPELRVVDISTDELESSSPQFCARSAVSSGELEALNEAVLTQISVIRPELLSQLMNVEPSRDGDLEYRPCLVRLADGTALDRVYVVQAEPHIRLWGIWPEHDRGKRSLSIDEVVQIGESPSRLPARLVTKMYEAGESGMGYCRFVLILRDGRRLPYVTGGAVDFVDLPPGVTPDHVLDLLPHEGAELHWEGPTADRADASDWGEIGYAWCLYRFDLAGAKDPG